MTHRFHATLKNDLADLAALPPRLEAFAEEASLPMDAAMHIDIVLDELLVNTISYGYPDGRPGVIDLRMDVADDVTIVIEDDGDAFDPLSLPPPDLESDLDDRPIGGLGVHFVRTMMDAVAYERVGALNRITLLKRLSTAGQPHANNN
ncbi:ATP-binding protein [Iodidimonas sp. SYSU 1G8]|uniref:ATP-binding protein n=1 Tax=Iodidimonas sp. SYSU 1G8 TaxID=3133967 RepID=UPI0031FEFC72